MATTITDGQAGRIRADLADWATQEPRVIAGLAALQIFEDRADVTDERRFEVASLAAAYLGDQGLYGEARRFAIVALNLSCRIHEKGCEDNLRALLGALRWKFLAGDADTTLSEFDKLRELVELVFGRLHPLTVEVRCVRILALRAMRHLAQAGMECQELSLELLDAGCEDLAVAVLGTTLGDLQVYLGARSSAREHYEAAATALENLGHHRQAREIYRFTVTDVDMVDHARTVQADLEAARRK